MNLQVMGDSNDCVVIELPRKLVLKSCQQDLSLASSFWFTLCNVLDSQLLEVCFHVCPVLYPWKTSNASLCVLVEFWDELLGFSCKRNDTENGMSTHA